jgi:MFS family permease
MRFHNIRSQWRRIRRHFIRFTWGGVWAAKLPADKRWNLTLFFYDGLFAAASDKIILTYLTIYLLSLGATRQQIGLLSSFSNLTAAFLLLPAAMLVERSGKPKRITLLTASGSRLTLLLLALIPLFFKDSRALIWIILGLALVRETFANMGYPGWMAITGDIIPIEGRGRYFGTRNFVMGLAGILTALFVGQAITQIGEPLGYQLAFIFAVILGVLSMSFFAHLKNTDKEDQEPVHQIHSGFKEILSSIRGEKQFIRFCVFTAVWNFSIYIAAPFFNVYMVDTLHFTAAMIGVVSVANTIANLLVQRRVGILSEKLGNRKVAVICLLLIPMVPLIWGLWVRQYWQAVLIEALSGILWGAYNLVSFNLLLLKTPEKQRARFSAFYQIVVTLGLAGGAALGAYLIPVFDFKGVTVASAVGRWLAFSLFILLVRESVSKTQENKI